MACEMSGLDPLIYNSVEEGKSKGEKLILTTNASGGSRRGGGGGRSDSATLGSFLGGFLAHDKMQRKLRTTDEGF